TKAVGITKETPEPFFYSDTLLKYDVFLLVTDGVGDVVPHDELETVLSSMEHTQEGLQTTARAIVVLAEHYNGSDNMTACIAQYGIYS
ncbi:MAG: hypothetical protein N3A54_02850, partial [Patescibacteria group bacterium]|nr:hypothetical protein [Patescibacteria group bacterium]